MPPAYEYDSLFHPRFKMFTVNSRHNGSQRIATFCLFHFSLMNLKNCKRKKMNTHLINLNNRKRKKYEYAFYKQISVFAGFYCEFSFSVS